MSDARIDGEAPRCAVNFAIAARAVAQHDGSIDAGEAPGGGLEVVISLPVTERAQGIAEASTTCGRRD